jgi:putative ABC transport system permease protein
VTTFRFVWKELFERPSQLLTSFTAITLGIAVIVAIQTMAHFSEKAVARELDALGANVLILPKGASVSDYYAADLEGEELPEEYVDRITTSSLQGVDNLSPKLTVPITVGEARVHLTGILPKNEFASKPGWADTGGIFARPQGCGTVAATGPLATLGAPASAAQQAAASRRAPIEELGANEVLVGSDVAARLGLRPGGRLVMQGRPFTVKRVLPETGSVDDGRVFAHLHTVQGLFGKSRVVNAIEMIGCCKEISRGLIEGLNKLLPDAKVVTIKQIAQTQLKTNRLMESFSLVFLVIIVIVGAAGIANYMFGNVQERRQEIGTLIALGMEPRRMLTVFLGKALVVGVAGGVVGYVVGTVMAMVLGPRVAQVPVLPLPVWLAWAVLLAVAIAAVASVIPARKAAHLDPAIALRDL